MDQTVFVPKSIGRLRIRRERFEYLISSPDLTYLMDAHDGLSCCGCMQASFKAIWASDLSISETLGYREVNETRWTN
ncbi:hypothetical protein [Rhizobium mayense]|uniref:Uncharacterized protein n=1 Tax=Rhizobium mayense TaxID=1312184 RepID=A0ABT7K1C8_9HYPH|nr:hypothetical protein [Rhizobium mayense]MDL2402418.1 hypothetical protein [Rhizobium mayense]